MIENSRCPRCFTVIGDGGKPGEKKHGWNVPAGGTVACHEATDEQLAERRSAVTMAEAANRKVIDGAVL